MHLLLAVTEEATLDSVSRDNIIQHKSNSNRRARFGARGKLRVFCARAVGWRAPAGE